MTGGLPPISSSWRQAPWDPRPQTFFFQLNPCGHSLCVTPSLMRRWVCLLWVCLAFRQVDVLHIWRVIENSSFWTIYKSSISSGFAKHIMRFLCILYYNSSLVIWAVISLSTTKFKPIIFYWTKSSLRPAYNSTAQTNCRKHRFQHFPIVAYWFVAVETLLKSFLWECVLFAKRVTR
jgi:hypothetical protein